MFAPIMNIHAINEKDSQLKMKYDDFFFFFANTNYEICYIFLKKMLSNLRFTAREDRKKSIFKTSKGVNKFALVFFI